MTREEAMQVVKDMLLVCQKFRSNLRDTINTLDPDIDREGAEQVHTELFPWVNGERDVTPLLIDITMGIKPLEGITLFNLMTIAHTLCPAIAAGAVLILPESRALPEPDSSWVALGWSDG